MTGKYAVHKMCTKNEREREAHERKDTHRERNKKRGIDREKVM